MIQLSLHPDCKQEGNQSNVLEDGIYAPAFSGEMHLTLQYRIFVLYGTQRVGIPWWQIGNVKKCLWRVLLVGGSSYFQADFDSVKRQPYVDGCAIQDQLSRLWVDWEVVSV